MDRKKRELLEELRGNYLDFLVDKVQNSYKEEIRESFLKIVKEIEREFKSELKKD